MWWVQILKSFPSHKFKWKTASERRLCDLFTDASAEDRWEGLGAVLFFGHMKNGRTMRVNNVPEVLLPFLPSKSEQKVRIAQLEMLAILLAIRTFGPALSGTYCRIHVDNVAAMYACLNGYSGNPYMARLAGEIWLELLHYNVAPWWQYVPSKLNVADIWSRPDKVEEEKWFMDKYQWEVINPSSHFTPLAAVLKTRPEVAWGTLHSRLYSGRR